MGRTARRRKRRKKENSNDFNSFDTFEKWILSQGWKQTQKLKLKNFTETGRGLMAMQNINSGDVIVRIPLKLLITAETVSHSQIGQIFINKGIKIPLHLVLTAFIIHEKHLGSLSFWNEYISVLPTSFTSPLFCSQDELTLFPKFITDKVKNTKEVINGMFNSLLSVTDSSTCAHCDTPLSIIVSKEDFLWSWFAVNSRVVFVSPSENVPHSIPLSDSNSFALAPYLDMLNHSNNSRVNTSFSLESGYVLKTLVSIEKYKQVFIHYGNHDNFKLFFDYGFILPSNENDVFPLEIADIIDSMINFSCVQRNLRFVQENCPTFLKDLYLSPEGLSWNCKALIYILCQPSSAKLKFILRNVYQGIFEESCASINIVGKLIIQKKIYDTEKSLEKITNFERNCILSIGRDLVKLYLSLLEKCFSTLIS